MNESQSANSNPQSAIRNPQSIEFVAFADPIYSESGDMVSSRIRRLINNAFDAGMSVPRLADSSREVTSIAEFFGDSSQVFLRQKATEQNVKNNLALQSARNIHFATHGIINERSSQLSGLLLGFDRDANEDGLLRTEEIYDLKLNADLVVLSACRTALGKNFRGEGVIGLTRGFLQAGAKSVVATLWQIEDASTADFMIDFYGRLKTSRNKTSALREAKLTMLKTDLHAHPHFWASFVLIGKP